jgi:cholesterol oxidase
MTEYDFDVIVVGSGFGGSVTALRLTEKGYRVAVLEAGPRFNDEDFASGTLDLKRFLWAPALGCYGIQRIDAVRDTMIVAGAGVGGGSLVYANTLYEPLQPFYEDAQWAHIADWQSELAPFYDQAKRMLGVVENPFRTPADDIIEKVAGDMGAGETYHATPVGVFFGGPEAKPGQEYDDPFFGGAGPARNACKNCGECMSGCRHNAKNTLVKNYLYLAEQNGAQVLPLTTVTRVSPHASGTGYDVRVKFTKAKTRRGEKVLTAEHVVMAAASLGTQKLLHRMKDEGHLPRLSERLGHLSRTNSESILGAISPPEDDTDYTFGVAITSSFHPDADTHIEPVRYGKGFNTMAMLQTVLTDGHPDPSAPDAPKTRVRAWLKEMWTQRSNIMDLYDLKHWSERTVIVLVMQSLDNSITTFGKKGPFGTWRMTSRQGHGAPNPTWIPVANDAVRRIAAMMGGTAGGNIGEPFGMPLTAHFIGGCAIGDSPETGVVDGYQRVYGHPGLHVADGSAISANLGVNPSLTITAQAERAMAFWPNKGEPDARPELGAAYQAISPVAPQHPVVPAGAPGALRLPIVEVS